MTNLETFGALRENFSGLVDFLTIYIEEAHPYERGDFPKNYKIDTHKVMDERMAAAQTLREEAGSSLSGCPIFVDPMDNRANNAYAATPERLYIIKDGKIVYEGGLGPFGYKLREVEEFLTKMK